MSQPYMYERDDEYQYVQNDAKVVIQTWAGSASELVFEHQYETTDQASKDFSSIVAGRAKGKGMLAIIATLCNGTGKANDLQQTGKVDEFWKITKGRATAEAKSNWTI